MPRLNQEQWEAIKVDFETNNLSYTVLAEKYNVSRGAINEKALKNKWVRGRTDNKIKDRAKKIIKTIQNHTNHTDHTETIQSSNAINRNALNLAVSENDKYISELTNKNLNSVEVNINNGLDIYGNKTAQETIDRASLTLGVNPRFANTTINNANNQQNNELKVTITNAEDIVV